MINAYLISVQTTDAIGQYYISITFFTFSLQKWPLFSHNAKRYEFLPS